MDIIEILDELGLGTPPGAGCQPLVDAMDEAAREVERLTRKYEEWRRKLDELLRRLPLPTREIEALMVEIARVEAELAAAKKRLADATAALKTCLAQAPGLTCTVLNQLLRNLIVLLRDFQREISGRSADPRRKAVIMRDIRRCQFAIAWVKALRRLLGCPPLPRGFPRVPATLRAALAGEGVPGPH
jgi:DNA repair exonuclease SbcCD ATPase subunit